jgi:hypothetical protein
MVDRSSVVFRALTSARRLAGKKIPAQETDHLDGRYWRAWVWFALAHALLGSIQATLLAQSDDKVDDNTGEQREPGMDNRHHDMLKSSAVADYRERQHMGRIGFVNRRFGDRLPSPAPEFVGPGKTRRDRQLQLGRKLGTTGQSRPNITLLGPNTASA